MNLDRFRASPSGRVLRAGQGDASYWAFAPNPLPPPLELDTRLARALAGADRALGKLAGLGRQKAHVSGLVIGVVGESSGKQRGRIHLATEIVRAVE